MKMVDLNGYSLQTPALPMALAAFKYLPQKRSLPRFVTPSLAVATIEATAFGICRTARHRVISVARDRC
jgi:hypothetical protein